MVNNVREYLHVVKNYAFAQCTHVHTTALTRVRKLDSTVAVIIA